MRPTTPQEQMRNAHRMNVVAVVLFWIGVALACVGIYLGGAKLVGMF